MSAILEKWREFPQNISMLLVIGIVRSFGGKKNSQDLIF